MLIIYASGNKSFPCYYRVNNSCSGHSYGLNIRLNNSVLLFIIINPINPQSDEEKSIK